MFIPGKIMISGEYSVTKNNHYSIVAAVYNPHIKNDSFLFDSKTKIKYGLGSSGVKSIKKIITSNKYKNLDTIFRKSFKHSKIFNKNNSGSDIAASTYGGVILYKKNKGLVDYLDFPNEWEILVGWTGSPFDTKTNSSIASKKMNKKFYNKNDKNTLLLYKNIKEKDFKSLKKTFSHLNDSLIKIPNVQTNKLKKLVEIANKYGAAGKISGSGGGDNGIAIIERNNKNKEKIIKEWEKEGIKKLELEIFNRENK